VRRRTRSPLWKVPVENEVREELAFHVEMRTREYVEAGMDEEEARRRAEARLGDARRLAADCRRIARRRDRRYRLADLADDVRADGRFALRQLARRPAFTAALVLILALAIGANVAAFSLLDRTLLQPPPYPRPQGLVTLWESKASSGGAKNMVGPANFVAWQEETRSFSAMSGFISVSATLGGDGEPLRAAARYVTDGYFQILGRPALLGRPLVAEDFAGEGRDVVVLSHGLWQRRFGGDAGVVGRTLPVDGTAREIVGVMPPGGLDMGPAFTPYGDAPDVWLPMTVSEEWRQPRGRWLMVLARLADGATAASAQTEMDALAERLYRRWPDFNDGWSFLAVPLAEHLRSDKRLPVLTLSAAVVLLLLVAGVNTAGLLLARAAGRGGEVAVRTALGAGPARLARQMLTEGCVLALAAGALGLALGDLALRFLYPLLPPHLTPQGPPALDLAAVGVTVALCLLCSLLFGLPPAFYAWRRQSGWLRAATAVGGRSRRRLRAALVFAEVAVAVVLLVAAGLLLRSTHRLLQVDPGFDRAGVVTISSRVANGTEETRVDQIWDQIVQRTAALPGVERAGAVTHVPLASAGAATSYYATDRPLPLPADRPVADVRIVRGDYFRTMGIPLLAGRGFDERERSNDKVGAVIVNESVARRLWPGESALGKRLQVYWGDDREREIVGVVGGVHHASLKQPGRDAVYFPHRQEIENGMTLVLRSGLDAEALLPAVRQVVAEVDPTMPLFDVGTLSRVVREASSEQRFVAGVVAVFALLALFLAGFGIFSVSAFAVAERGREIGLRLALGASRGAVARMVLRQAAVLTGLALAAGLALSLLAGRFVESLLFEVRPGDPLTLATVTAVLAACALLAAWGPARRAAAVAPMQALRLE